MIDAAKAREIAEKAHDRVLLEILEAVMSAAKQCLFETTVPWGGHDDLIERLEALGFEATSHNELLLVRW